MHLLFAFDPDREAIVLVAGARGRLVVGAATFGSAFFAALLVRPRAFVIGVAFCMSSS